MQRTFSISLCNKEIEVVRFDCPENLSIFRGARLAGIEMSAGCMQGRCQICRATLLSGEVKSLRPLSKYATNDPAALPNNAVLPCSVVPCSDVTLSPRGPWRVDPDIAMGESSFTMLALSAMPVWD